MKKLFLLFVAVMFAAVTLPACSDDDEGNDNPPTQTDDYASLIVGKGEKVHYSDGDRDFDVVPGSLEWNVYTFMANGIYVSQDKYGSGTGIYSIDGNTITFIYQGELGLNKYGVDTIKTLTATTLVLDHLDGSVSTYKGSVDISG